MEGKTKFSLALKYYNKIVAIALALIAVGTVFYHLVEKFSWVNSLYFTVVTLATIGYGDFAPKTTAGKLFTVGYVILGIAVFVALANVLIAKVVSLRMEHKRLAELISETRKQK